MKYAMRFDGAAFAALLPVLSQLSMLAGCASGPPGALRFENRAPVWHVADRQPVPAPEPSRQAKTYEKLVHDVVRRPALHAMSVPEPSFAKDVNALGEVPDSAWFTNRIGLRDLTAADVAGGPDPDGAPEPSGPWTVVRGKAHGAALGFVVEDVRGRRFLFKLDDQDEPELTTGAEAAAARLLWAAGYNVPRAAVVLFDRDQIVVADDASQMSADGREEPWTEEDLDALLARAARTADGRRWRALASKYLDGRILGGFAMEGRREDDPNDRIPHQHRRSLRGLEVVCAWLGHTDVKEDNTLDVWVEDPPGSELGHVVHYLIDFGKAFGGKGHAGAHPADGWAHSLDYGYAAASLVTLGGWTRPWEGIPASDLRGVGRYEAQRYEPERYRPTRFYAPFWFADRFDAYWAAKIVARFGPKHVEAAVEEGRYSDPRTRAYLTRTILARQRETARYWMRRVNPVDHFETFHEPGGNGWGLCGRDLWLVHGFGDEPGEGETRYRLAAYDYAGGSLPWRRELVGRADGSVCVSGPGVPRADGGYVIVVLRTRRGEEELPPVAVHLARAPQTGHMRVIGVRRY